MARHLRRAQLIHAPHALGGYRNSRGRRFICGAWQLSHSSPFSQRDKPLPPRLIWRAATGTAATQEWSMKRHCLIPRRNSRGEEVLIPENVSQLWSPGRCRRANEGWWL